MSKRANINPSSMSMQELFRVEAETQTAQLTSGLLAIERTLKVPVSKFMAPSSGATNPELGTVLESLMRSAHSLKGAARIVNLAPAVQVAHAMEDCFVAAQQNLLTLGSRHVDTLLRGVDLLTNISQHDESSIDGWLKTNRARVESWLKNTREFTPARESAAGMNLPATVQTKSPEVESLPPTRPATTIDATTNHDRVLRLTAESLNRLLGLAGESLVESRWLRPFSENMQRLKRMQARMERTIDSLRQLAGNETLSEPARAKVNELFAQAAEARQFLADRLEELDLHDRRTTQLSHRLYLEVLRTRMRPFADGVSHFPRMVRDLAQSLGKNVRLELVGENTQVDRDILDRLEAPLAHLLRNAVDHGCEFPVERAAIGKPEEAVVRLEARHSAGMLQVIVSDDGAGLDINRVRRAIIAKKLVAPSLAERMTDSELLQFLFLPGFTLKETVTEISGRGVGLDIVQNMARGVRGSVRVTANPGRGMRFQLQLPLTLSVLRALLVEIGGEPYAFPLAQLLNTLKLPREKVETLEGRHHFRLGEQHIGLLAAHQVFECHDVKPPEADLPIVVLGDRNSRYGLLVDKFLGERELVVQPLDARLGKVKDISAAALMEDGAPVLIVDVEDMVRSIEKLVNSGELTGVSPALLGAGRQKRKRILVVDDSLTVRELERKLLITRGYHTDVAIDGMDGWNAVRSGEYDLVITDVDMPRMDGVELAGLIKTDPHLKSLPVMIVSYKEREEDRLRGLEAGADYYLTKGSFHDEALLEAVIDLIGEPEA